MMNTPSTFERPSAVAGSFFPADPGELQQAVKTCVNRGAAGWRPSGPSPRAIISPHAGYRFSGWLTGAAWLSTSRAEHRRVVILSPSHQHAFDGIALPSQAAYAMPGFDVAIDQEACALLMQAGLAHVEDAAHDREHGIETQLGFLNHLHKGAKVIPLVIGNVSVQTVAQAVDRLAALRPAPLFVLSSDLSHFLTLEKAQQHDLATARLIETGKHGEITSGHACGARGVAGFMASAVGQGLKVQRLAMASSHAVNSDASRTVGYGSWMFFNPEEDSLLPRHRKNLLRLARRVLTLRFKRGGLPKADVSSFVAPLQGHGASFVTLEIEGRLRGCIGSLSAHQPLVQDVLENTLKSAFNDPRFRPVTIDELPDLTIKIALLSPAKPMRFSDEADLLSQLEPGRDGLILRDQGKRSTFLPMVWNSLEDPKAFLEALKVKAGLPKEHWSDSIKVDRYCAESFSEADEPA